VRAEEMHWDRFSPDETPQRDPKEVENQLWGRSSKRERVELVPRSDVLPCLGEHLSR